MWINRMITTVVAVIRKTSSRVSTILELFVIVSRAILSLREQYWNIDIPMILARRGFSSIDGVWIVYSSLLTFRDTF